MSSHDDRFIDLQSVGQVFDTARGPFVALRDIDLRIAKGEFLALCQHCREQGKTLIVVTHSEQILHHFTRVYRLKEGKLRDITQGEVEQ